MQQRNTNSKNPYENVENMFTQETLQSAHVMPLQAVMQDHCLAVENCFHFLGLLDHLHAFSQPMPVIAGTCSSQLQGRTARNKPAKINGTKVH